MFDNMTLNDAVTAITGFMVLFSVFLTRVVSDGFVFFSIFIGIMAIQAAFTGFCPTTTLLKKYNLVK